MSKKSAPRDLADTEAKAFASSIRVSPQKLNVVAQSIRGLKADAALKMIRSIVSPLMPVVGERFLGTVVKTADFGAFISLMPGKDGLLHVSQVRKLAGGKRVENVADVVPVGSKVQVEITAIDDRGKISLSVVDDSAAAESAPAAE